MSNELALTTLDDVIKVGQIAERSKNFGGIDADKATMKILAGKEMGLGAIASLNGLYIFKDTIGIQVSIMAGLVKSSPKYHYNILTESDDDEKCEIEFLENGQKIGVSRFSVKEAERAGLLSKDNWKKWLPDMLFNRAFARGFRRYCPDLGTGPVYTKEEMEDMDMPTFDQENGVIEAVEYSEVVPEQTVIDNEKARQKWIEAVMKQSNYPEKGNPPEKVVFINKQLESKGLGLAPMTVPELLTLTSG